MGFGSKLKKAVKKVTKPVESVTKQVADPVRDVVEPAFKQAGKDIGTGATKFYKEYDRYTSSDWGAYLTPYLSMYDSDGRDALVSAYGGYATVGASAYNPAAGAVVGTAVNAYNAQNAPTSRPTAGGAAFAPTEQPAATPQTPADAGGVPWWLIGGALGAVALTIAVVLIVKKRG